jgi:hypothetical protein
MSGNVPVTGPAGSHEELSMAEINELFQWGHRPIWWDPIPPWVAESLSEAVRAQLLLRDIELQQNILKLQQEALGAKAEILRGAVGG